MIKQLEPSLQMIFPLMADCGSHTIYILVPLQVNKACLSLVRTRQTVERGPLCGLMHMHLCSILDTCDR